MSNLHPPYLHHHQPTEAASRYPLKRIENQCDGFTLATIGDGEVKCSYIQGIEFMTAPQWLRRQSLQPDVLEVKEALFKSASNKDSNFHVLCQLSLNLNISLLNLLEARGLFSLPPTLWKHVIVMNVLNVFYVLNASGNANGNIVVDMCN